MTLIDDSFAPRTTRSAQLEDEIRAHLLLIVALAVGRTPDELADEIGSRGAAALKAKVTEAVNEHLRPLRERRRTLAADPGYLRAVLATGNRNANQIATATLDEVRRCMDMTY
jgi:tryptophanyl-tRNA synthetase